MNFFNTLLQQVTNPDTFVAMVNVWMSDPLNRTSSIDFDVDQFLQYLLDEQRTTDAPANYDDLFDSLIVWMKQASVEHRCAMLFNSTHMIGLSCLDRIDDVELLRSVPESAIFLPSRTSDAVSLSFVANLLLSGAEHCLTYIFSSSTFASIIGEEETCFINGRFVYLHPDELKSLLWRVFVPAYNNQTSQNIARLVENLVLDRLRPLLVDAVLDVVSADASNAVVQWDFFNDERFKKWPDCRAYLQKYITRESSVLPPHLNIYLPSCVDVFACNCAYLLQNLKNSALPKQQIEARNIIQSHPDGVGIVRRSIEKLNTIKRGWLKQFPSSEVEILLDALTPQQMLWWRDHAWQRDAEFSVNQYAPYLRAILNDSVSCSSFTKKRVL